MQVTLKDLTLKCEYSLDFLGGGDLCEVGVRSFWGVSRCFLCI